MKKFLFIVVILVASQEVRADIPLNLNLDHNSMRIFQVCGGDFLGYLRDDVEDESLANRMQHLAAQCAMAEAGNILGLSSWQSNVAASLVMTAQELSNQNPNFEEVVLSLSADVRGNCRVHFGVTIDGYGKLLLSCALP